MTLERFRALAAGARAHGGLVPVWQDTLFDTDSPV
jgi:hypothetical protein